MARLTVMRQRRHRTLLKKIREFSGLFDEDVAIVLRDKTTGESKVYKSADDPEWLPELSHQNVTIVGGASSSEAQEMKIRSDLRWVEKRVRNLKFPKVPKN